MKIQLRGLQCIVTREAHDPKYYGVRNAAGESALLYAIKKQLNDTHSLGLIKKRMWKDGHMVDDMQQYLRNADWSVAIYNTFWQIRGADVDFNKGEVVLTIANLRDKS